MERSINYNIVRNIFDTDKDQIEKKMISIVEMVLADPKEGLNGKFSPFAYRNLLADGSFEPFFQFDRHFSYRDAVEENGNEDDETDFITLSWINALAKADPVKYGSVIAKFADIAVNGL